MPNQNITALNFYRQTVVKLVLRHYLHFYVAVSKLSKVVEQECNLKPTGAGKKTILCLYALHDKSRLSVPDIWPGNTVSSLSPNYFGFNIDGYLSVSPSWRI